MAGIGDPQPGLPIGAGAAQFQRHPAGAAGMLADIGDSLLRHAEQGRLDLGRPAGNVAGKTQVDGEAIGLKPFGQPAQPRLQPQVVQDRRPQATDDAAQFRQTFARDGRQPRPLGSVKLVGRAGALDHPDHGGHRLGDAIVEIMGDAAAFLFLRGKQPPDEEFQPLLAFLQGGEQAAALLLAGDAVHRRAHQFQVQPHGLAVLGIGQIIDPVEAGDGHGAEASSGFAGRGNGQPRAPRSAMDRGGGPAGKPGQPLGAGLQHGLYPGLPGGGQFAPAGRQQAHPRGAGFRRAIERAQLGDSLHVAGKQGKRLVHPAIVGAPKDNA